jgi:hypothetical protein
MARLTNRDAIAVADKHGIKGELRSAFLTYWVCEGDRDRTLKRLRKYPELVAAFEGNEGRMLELFSEAAMVEAERTEIPKHLKD